MSRIQELESKVKALYAQDHEDRADWAEWLYGGHVLPVADFATELARRFGADEDLARAGALLHDIADVKMKRAEANHAAVSLQMARSLLGETGYSEDEIKLLVDDAIKYHSCHNGECPESLEGKVLATADSLAHLKTDFYLFSLWTFGRQGKTLAEVKEWALAKIERDLNNKISFDEVREEARPDYESIKELFSR